MSVNDLGAVPASTTIYLFWTSHDLATGANETMSALAVGDILIYKNGSVTQRSSTSGFTLLDTDGIDFDALTGVNGVSIDLSDNTDAGFYAVGSWYTVILGPVTIDTQTVYINLATFRIVAAEAITGKPKVDVDGWNGTAIPGVDTAGYPKVTIKDGTGTGEIDTSSGKVSITDGAISSATFAAGAINAAAIAADAIGASELAADAVAEIAGAVWDIDATGHQTGGTFGQAIGDPAADTNTIFGAVVTNATGVDVGTDTSTLLTRMGTPSNLGGGATLAGNLSDIEAQTDDIGAAGAGLTGIPDSAGTTTLLTRLSATRAGYLDNLSAGAVALEASVQSVLSKLLKYFQLALRKDAAIATDNATELTAINADGGSGAGAFANTTDALEALRDRGDAAWTTATGFSTLDAAGVRTAVGLASANLDTQLTAIDDYIDTEVAAIKAKTDNLPTDPADASDIAALIDAIPTAVENADALLGRNIAGGSSTGRLVKEALATMRNKWTLVGGTLTVYDTDDTTVLFTASVTQTAGDPVSAMDPA